MWKIRIETVRCSERRVAVVAVELVEIARAMALFRRWQRDGTWARILTALQALADAAGRIWWDVSVDSTVTRAHQHAAGARKRGICRTNHRAVSRPNPLIMLWVDHGVD